jgi:hypothetical protein
MPDGRRVAADGDRRRWIRGRSSADVSAAALDLLRHASERLCRWTSLGRAAGPGLDQVDAERLVWELVDAALAEVHEKRDRRGEWAPYEWRATKSGRVAVRVPDEAPDIDAWLAVEARNTQPALASCRAWLCAKRETATRTQVALVMAIGDELRAGRLPTGRLLSLAVAGSSKAIRMLDHRDLIEAATGLPLEQVVRLHGAAVRVFGPLRFRLGGDLLDATWSVPWLALTPETIRDMRDLDVRLISEIRTIENLTAFEEEVRRGREPGVLYLYTGGFPGAYEIKVLKRVIEAGVARIRHWGDLDLGGMRILRYLSESLPVRVEAWRMEPELLSLLPTSPLSDLDHEGLSAWLADPDAPLCSLARALLDRGVKAEQEGWFLSELATQSRLSPMTTPD